MESQLIQKVTVDKAQYHPGERVKIEIFLKKGILNDITNDDLKVEINDLDQKFYNTEIRLIGLKQDLAASIVLFWQIPKEIHFEGFGLDVKYYKNEQLVDSYSTGFDVVEKWFQAPRYGFLSEFKPDKKEKDIYQRLEIMKDFHLNIIQFYDWMYRHHQLLSLQEEYKDIFNRPLSSRIVKKQVDGCKKNGMLPIAYGAMYGAEREFVVEHPDWIAATRDGVTKNSLCNDNPEYIQIMNIADNCPWREHIVDQYQQVIEKLGFEGIHIDQYGFPKTYYSLVNNKRELKDMAAEFGRFIEYTRKELGEEAALIFNAVNNWPVEVVASKPQDVVYIEVWSPNDTFYHLRQLILEAKKLANYKKQIILAAYISSLNKKKKISQEAGERAARLTAATIFANGSFHLVLGEGANILTDAYYPEFRQLTAEFRAIMQNYYDLITRYSKYLFSQNLRDKSAFLTGGINDEIKVSVNGEKMNFSPNGEKDSIWTIVKENKKFKTLNLVNLMGIDTIKWDKPQYTDPKIQQYIEIEWLIDEEVKAVYWITADKGDIKPRKIDFICDKHERGEIIKFTIPELNYWGLVIVKVY
ncbi:MAG TPA: hypothetical protein ENG48_13520 [Candidatus Atribacteria bacterium]|nr:MAG: hypothetical protein DRH33_03440 [Candidatus Nealsonbacteria bacterium]HDK28092.1 hypothetical protein [Candidatus Atribacteria bacterium]